MATLVFSAVGTLVGGPLGGTIGALVGRQVDAAILGSPRREGPRLKELTATTSSYGTPIARHFGRMRVPGTIIWSTELEESSETQGGGKGRPSVTTYSYSASFAVALSSRPIRDIGRIWADGNLLRGEAGDLKATGQMRIYTGHGDQESDPLIAGIEGPDRCPAFRGLAYVVFEDLELADFFNRIPALTFEVIADEEFSLQDIVGELIDDADAPVPLHGFDGFSSEGPLNEVLQSLDPLLPIDADAGGEKLKLGQSEDEPVRALPQAAISVGDGEFGGPAGFSRSRLPPPESPPQILRYYDTGRDYLPGMQRAMGRPPAGEPRTVEIPAALTATNARILIERTRRRADWSRDRIAWRTTELDPVIGPGSRVSLPDRPGNWRVNSWEWREEGVEFALQRIVPAGASQDPGVTVDPGRLNPPLDLAPPPTTLIAYQMPWDGTTSGHLPVTFAAVSSAGPNWSGAALFADHGDGELQPLGPSGRTRSIVGETTSTLPAANPLLLDRQSTLTVDLLAEDMTLLNATARQLAMGANMALIGNEIIQFAAAFPLGGTAWRLERLLRGRGGTEAAVSEHMAGETFVLLDARPVLLDPAPLNASPQTIVVASGRGDAEPVQSGIALEGITLRPLSPVHPRPRILADGSMMLAWTRRARGAWLWPDGAETPLHEELERYEVSLGPVQAPYVTWIVDEPLLMLSALDVADLANLHPGAAFHVRQKGNYSLSEPLLLATIS